MFSYSTLLAEEQDPIEKLDPIVITATTSPTRLSQAPAAMTIITRDEIAQQQANRLSTILQQVPGVFVDEMGGRGGMSSISIRGGDPNFTLIMIDGIPINDPSNSRGGSVNLSALTPERVERVEIVRGPVSVIYGSDAMAGAINIITQKGQPNSQFHSIAEGGQFGYGRGVLQARGAMDDVFYSGSFSYTRNDEQVEGDGFQNLTTGGNLDWSLTSSADLQISGQYSHSEIQGFPEGSGGPRLAVLRTTERRLADDLVFGLTLNHLLAPAWEQNFSANVFHRKEDVNTPGIMDVTKMFRSPPAIFHTDFSRYRFLWSLHHEFPLDWELSGGLQLIHEDGTRTGIQQLTAVGFPADQPTDFEEARTILAGFFEATWSPFSSTTVTGSLRVDDPERISPEVSPRVAITVQWRPDTSVRGSYSEGFKLPSFNALSDPQIGNPALVPETSRGWDFTLHQELFQTKVQVDLTYFHNRFSNVIDLDPALARQNIFTLVNLSTVETNGIELGLTATPNTWLQVKGFFTYLHSDILGSDDSLRNRPNTSGGLILTLHPHSQLLIRSQLQTVGERFDLQVPTTQTSVPAYYRLDVAATLRLNDSWEIFVVAENTTNVRYEEFLGFEAPGAGIRFGLDFLGR